MKFMPAGAFDDLIEPLTKVTTGDTQAINSVGIRLNQVTTTQFNGVDAEVVRKLVEMRLYSITRLRRAMTTLRATRRLVGKKTHALKLIAGQLVGHGLQGAGVVGCSDALRAIRPAIEERAEVHCCQRAIALGSCSDPHFYAITTTCDHTSFSALAP